jgi:hypothetical protein
MTTSIKSQNSANALKVQQDDPGTAQSQTEREMLESRCQGERHPVKVCRRARRHAERQWRG